MRHQRKPRRKHQAASAQYADSAEPVGNDAGQRLTDAPEEILQRQREREHVAAPMVGKRHRGEKEAER